MSENPNNRTNRRKRLSLWPIKPKDALETMLRTPLPGKKARVEPEPKRKAK